jgi:putative DNA primase/helicase
MKTRKPKPAARHPRSEVSEDQTVFANLHMALRYAQEGISVVPLHGFKKGVCTCSDPACDQRGKHPRTKNGVCDAATDLQLVERRWKKWPKAKIGIAFGGPNRLVGLLIEGEAGWTNVRTWTRHRRQLPRTVTILDGEDCEIRLFKSENALNDKGEIAEGLRLLGDGDFVVAPSSLKASSASRRQFRSNLGLGQIKIALAPSWLGERAANSVELAEPAGKPTAASTIVIVPTSEIQPHAVTWIWPGVIASGRVTSLVGYPGLGKSQVSIDIAATISTGRPWPREAYNDRAGHVLILPAEDDAADTIAPRLIAAGADRAAVHLVKAVKDDDGVERAFSLATDLERLEREYDLNHVRLLIVDPVTAYLGKENVRINRNQGSDIRPLLDRLTAFAGRHDLGVLAISHLNKSAGARAITRIMGSLEFVAVARAVYLVTEDPGSSRRLFLPVKNNLAADRVGYAFELETRVVGDGIQTSAVKWSDDQVTISADEALATAKRASSGAIDFLRQALSDGPVDQTEIMRSGKEAGYSEKILRTAREKLGATSKREGGVGARGSGCGTQRETPRC